MKNTRLRHAEYYGMTEIFDELYVKSKDKQKFKNLMSIITSDNNILLAYRNIKRNNGSATPGVDEVTIKDVEELGTHQFIGIVKKRFKQYNPRKVKRVEIPKPNGKTRPLGIPSMWDRIAQQCILQVLEPICEANFYKYSYGFRPTKSAENAISTCNGRINNNKMQYVVDIDIKGFFDEVKHSKLMRQIWTMGIRDKQLLVIIRKMLKAPIVLPNGEIVHPTKGTPQGGILSPLLANITLNEFDWWIANQWESKKCRTLKDYLNKKTGWYSRQYRYQQLRKTSTLKEMYIVRYADDFKIFTTTRLDAEKIFMASKMWLEERLNLTISEEKSQITNLKKKSSEFLGFELKMERKGYDRFGRRKYVCQSHIAEKARKRIKKQLKDQIKLMQRVPNGNELIKNVRIYNSMVIGIHNYYQIATQVVNSLMPIQYQLTQIERQRLKQFSLRKTTNYPIKDKGIKPYLKSKMTRYINGYPLIPIGFIKTKTALMPNNSVNKFTKEGRELIHREQKSVPNWQVQWIREHPIINERATIEFNDNRISLFIAQNGKCAVTGEELILTEMDCHHKTLWSKTKDDSYSNLVLITRDVHRLIHATDVETIQRYLEFLELNEEQLIKLNKLRLLIGNEIIE
ncbi:reverse transcriptase family protein [Bacillus cereus ATCC 4342]|nr:group II intron reverse transcriptase/maturase [Bacillus tropicus]AJH72192.1 group II intron reverse transcriptase/maturase [Bacillus cereus ATCC 4342]EEK82147.1 Group II intron reverse transcriptase/maturase pXO1-23 [Bacillus cereus ATCC 4342]KFM87734.1 reverse transcriptase family protein [Bacillus cereus ATCC 4342]QKH55790.1 group II intron reverse transcriptase/maturase [Bacillus tropicus]